MGVRLCAPDTYLTRRTLTTTLVAKTRGQAEIATRPAKWSGETASIISSRNLVFFWVSATSARSKPRQLRFVAPLIRRRATSVSPIGQPVLPRHQAALRQRWRPPGVLTCWSLAKEFRPACGQSICCLGRDFISSRLAPPFETRPPLPPTRPSGRASRFQTRDAGWLRLSGFQLMYRVGGAEHPARP